MNRLSFCLAGMALGLGILSNCATVAVHEPTAEEQQEAYDQERYQAKILFHPAAPQAISGFLRLGRVYSATMGSAAVLKAGNPQDLDMIIDAVNEFTEIKTESTPDLTYSDPRLFDLPIIIPQNPPNEVEMEQLTRYLLEGGFILDTGLGFEVFREGLEKYGGLIWGQDAWFERLPEDHPLFRSFFELGEVSPPSEQRMQGLFVKDRLAVVAFDALGKRLQERLPGAVIPPNPLTRDARKPVSPAGWQMDEELTEELSLARRQRFSDLRFQQWTVNVVVYALTQEGSIAQRRIADE